VALRRVRVESARRVDDGRAWLLRLACGHQTGRARIPNVFETPLSAPRHVVCADCRLGATVPW
jgi:hypothetical protein